MPLKDKEKKREYQIAYSLRRRLELNAQRRAYYEAHREDENARSKMYGVGYRVAHRNEIKAHDRVYHLAHREERNANMRVYRKAHLEEEKARKHAYNLAHRQEQQAYNYAYHLAHRGEQKAHKRAHPAIHRVNNARRRAWRRGLPATLTSDQWQAIQRVYHHRCAYCGSKPKMLTQEHVIPLSKGGGTTPENIVPACQSCNSRKHTGPPPVIPPVRLLI